MNQKKQSFDSGLTENIILTDYDGDFIEEKGFDEWTTYRKDWQKYCNLEEESSYPIHLEIELNYSCNLKCPFCTWSSESIQEKRSDWFTFEEYKKIIDKAVNKGTKAIRLCYINEPLIRPDLDQFIKYASDAGILDIIITTNGTLMTKAVSKKLIEAGLTKLNVSLDAATKETYDKVRVGGDFEKTIKNIHDFLDVRKDLGRKLPKIRLSFVVSKINQHEYDEFVKYWEKKVDSLGVQYVQNPFGEGKFEDKTRGDQFMIENKKSRPPKFYCSEPFKRLTLRSNGDVLPCCSFYAVDMLVGNWKNTSLEEIWNGQKMRELRGIHKKGEYYKNKICKNCVENYSYIAD